MPLLLLDNIAKHYGDAGAGVSALAGVSLSIDEGEFVAIMGPSGSGKSTLLSILGAMSPPSEGRLIVDEIDVYDLSHERQADFRREYLGFVFQQLQLIPYLNALENVMLPLVVTDADDKPGMARAALERMGLGRKADRLPGQLSGGEQSRVAIARAIVNEPPIVLADEPVGSLDTKTGGEVLDLFRSLHGEGQTIIMVTHNPESVRDATRIIQLLDGRITADERGLTVETGAV